MSQTGRQDFTDKVHNAVKPDSQKTFGEQTADWTKGKADTAASTFQPQGNKSTTQKVGDAVSGNHNHNVDERSFMDKTKDALGINRNKGTDHTF
ncbi:SubName: Full=Uncharacterized protein {ECO:0000313/EMBL:CCA67134.1} [Serendipita indica DSM 11827]|uniref:Uncharacterized protein n=1 Tax=Serendipita indica (strain DSM 11827) TaxID=1109443 RepID=G4T7A1_SERID|nr:SubName: Full=Uncharacterized protein {ECO:0000313/EMBL:CCA67134.1} [Serendipita indica DSM 11827]CCA67134.1 hypothetical protein PIIN_00968 [Serendipita indica DSM 11827]